MMTDDELIKHLKEVYRQRDTSNFNVLDFVGAFGSPLEACLYARLFWPHFVEFEDMVFLKETIEYQSDKDKILRVLNSNSGDRSKTEQEFNLIEIPSDLFSFGIGGTTEEEDRFLSSQLSEMWSIKLKNTFPTKKFVVRVVEPNETGGEVGVIFFIDRSLKEDDSTFAGQETDYDNGVEATVRPGKVA